MVVVVWSHFRSSGLAKKVEKERERKKLKRAIGD